MSTSTQKSRYSPMCRICCEVSLTTSWRSTRKTIPSESISMTVLTTRTTTKRKAASSTPFETTSTDRTEPPPILALPPLPRALEGTQPLARREKRTKEKVERKIWISSGRIRASYEQGRRWAKNRRKTSHLQSISWSKFNKTRQSTQSGGLPSKLKGNHFSKPIYLPSKVGPAT